MRRVRRFLKFDPFVTRTVAPAALLLLITGLMLFTAALWAAHRSDVLAIDRQRAASAAAAIAVFSVLTIETLTHHALWGREA